MYTYTLLLSLTFASTYSVFFLLVCVFYFVWVNALFCTKCVYCWSISFHALSKWCCWRYFFLSWLLSNVDVIFIHLQTKQRPHLHTSILMQWRAIYVHSQQLFGKMYELHQMQLCSLRQLVNIIMNWNYSAGMSLPIQQSFIYIKML